MCLFGSVCSLGGVCVFGDVCFVVCTQNLMEQPDFLVVGCLGLQGVGKSTIMSLLAGSRTGSGR